MFQPAISKVDQSEYLSVLSQAPAGEVKRFADQIIPELGPIEVLVSRTGLVMLPMVETVKGAFFYVGEVLVAEARVRVEKCEGYAVCLGRDTEKALAVALIDVATTLGLARDKIAPFVRAQADRLAETENALLRQVEATRVEMETF